MSWYSDIKDTLACLCKRVRALENGGGGTTYTAGTGLQLVADEFSIADPTALKTLTLAQFAATTSAQLAGVISNETGFSGAAALVFSINPIIDGMRPINGLRDSSLNELVDFAQVASAVNYVQFSNAATGNGPIVGAVGDNANVDLNLEGKGTGVVKFQTFEIGWKQVPQNSQSVDYTTVLADGGKHILHPTADASARTITIDSNANVAYPIGTALTFVNQDGAGVLSIAITADTMRLAGAGTTGTRTLAANGIATALKITSTEWLISGTGLT